MLYSSLLYSALHQVASLETTRKCKKKIVESLNLCSFYYVYVSFCWKSLTNDYFNALLSCLLLLQFARVLILFWAPVIIYLQYQNAFLVGDLEDQCTAVLCRKKALISWPTVQFPSYSRIFDYKHLRNKHFVNRGTLNGDNVS